jgi:hypothetical protein
MAVNDEFERMWKETVVPYSHVLSQKIPLNFQ